MILNAHAGTKYGVSFPVLCRASFGVKGANVPAILRALVACGWFGIQTWIGGLALNTLLVALWPGMEQDRAGSLESRSRSSGSSRCGSSCKGLEGIKKLEGWSAPLLLAGGAPAPGLGGRDAAADSGTSSPNRAACAPARRRSGVVPGRADRQRRLLGDAEPEHSDFTRYAQKPALAGARPGARTSGDDDGVRVHRRGGHQRDVVVFGEPIWDPVALIARIGSAPVIIFGALVVMLAQLTTNMAANVVSPANDFSSLAPRRISYVTGGLITAAIGIVMMPWKLYADAAAYIFTWLIGYSSLMGAIGGILIADYWMLRRRELSTADLFKPDGRYTLRARREPRRHGSRWSLAIASRRAGIRARRR